MSGHSPSVVLRKKLVSLARSDPFFLYKLTPHTKPVRSTRENDGGRGK